MCLICTSVSVSQPKSLGFKDLLLVMIYILFDYNKEFTKQGIVFSLSVPYSYHIDNQLQLSLFLTSVFI
jgi:hypothetical protein